MKKKTVCSAVISAVLTAAFAVSVCMASDTAIDDTAFAGDGKEPYSVKTLLKEYTAADPSTGKGVYGRYTELVVEDGAPQILKEIAADCNRRAREAVTAHVDSAVPASVRENAPLQPQGTAEYVFTTYSYIVAITRADDTAISFLETELENERAVRAGIRITGEYRYRFFGKTYETASGKEIQLSDVLGGEADPARIMEEALLARYGTEGLAQTGSSDYAWTADALGIRFYFHSDAVSEEKLSEINIYSPRAITVTVPFTALTGEAAGDLAKAPEDYIAQIEPDTLYDLPGGDMSVMITKKDDRVVLRRIPDAGQEEDLIIEYADQESVFYILRSQGGFYLFRERIAYEEGFFYDFSRPDGGFGRFAYETAQYFDSYLREIGLALPYSPKCVRMCEKRRSFGEKSYDSSSFIPHGHYSFPDKADGRYKRFQLTDGSLSIDTYNVACRLLEDFPVTALDEEGNEAGEYTVKAGRALFFEQVTGEGDRYLPPPQRSNSDRVFTYEARLSDGKRVRFVSDYESTIFTNGAYMNRFTEPVSLWEAQYETEPEPEEVFTVLIGGKEYPVIPDYTKADHRGEEIDFGDDLWWEVEGYVGSYRMTKEDLEELEDEFYMPDALAGMEDSVSMTIGADGHVVLHYFDETFEGDLPQRRFYKKYPTLRMASEYQWRVFQISLLDGDYHSVPHRVELYSEGEPATNEPSTVPPLMAYLTKE